MKMHLRIRWHRIGYNQASKFCPRGLPQKFAPCFRRIQRAKPNKGQRHSANLPGNSPAVVGILFIDSSAI